MCRLAALTRRSRARSARAVQDEQPFPPHSLEKVRLGGTTLRHGLRAPNAPDEDNEPNVSTQRTVFLEVANPALSAPGFGKRTLSGVGIYDRAPAQAFTPEYAPALPDPPSLAWLKEYAVAEPAIPAAVSGDDGPAEPPRASAFAFERTPFGAVTCAAGSGEGAREGRGEPARASAFFAERGPTFGAPDHAAASGEHHAAPERESTLAAERSTLKLELGFPRLHTEMPLESVRRPLPLVARIRPVPVAQPKQTQLAWLGGLCAIGLVGLSVWPFELNAVAHGTFKRFSRVELAVSPVAGRLAAVHVSTGQRVLAGEPLVSFDLSEIERELEEVNTKLEHQLVALVQAQMARQSELDADALKRSGALQSITQRALRKRADLAQVEAQRDELLKAQAQSYVSPVKLSAIDDQVDARRQELRAVELEREKVEAAGLAATPAAAETEQLARDVEAQRGRRNELQHRLRLKHITAAVSGTVTQLLHAPGDLVASDAPLARILPDSGDLRLIARFSPEDASELRGAKAATLTLAADPSAVSAHFVRVSAESSALEPCCSVELTLDDAASVSELDRQLRGDARITLELTRESTLLALAAERLHSGD